MIDRIWVFLLTLIFLPYLGNTILGYSKKSFCLDEIPVKNLSLQCPDHHLIKLGRIVYGFSWTKECSYIDQDCTMDVPGEDLVCQSSSHCTVHVIEYPLILQGCWNLPASYVQAEFECIEDFVLQSPCQKQETNLPHGFIASPSYPLGSFSNLHCLCILSPSLNHSIALEIVDFRLPICTDAGVVLNVGDEYQTKCLTEKPITLIGNYQQNVSIRFYTVNNFTQGGFLLKYAILPLHTNGTVQLECKSMPPINQGILTKIQYQTTKLPYPTDSIVDFDDFEQVLMTSTPMLKFKQNQIEYASIDTYFKSKKELFNMTGQSDTELKLSQSNKMLESSNIRMLVILIIVGLVFFFLILNFFIWLLCTSRQTSTTIEEFDKNLYFHSMDTNDNKIQACQTPALFPMPKNRLKTLRSLLYPDQKTSDFVSSTKYFDSELNIVVPECNRSKIIQDSGDLCKTTFSSSTNLTHGFFIKSKFEHDQNPNRMIDSWDDV